MTGIAVLFVFVGAASAAWTYSTASLAARGAQVTTSPGDYTVFLCVLGAILAQMVRQAAHGRWTGLGLRAVAAVAWLAAGPPILTVVLPRLAQSTVTRQWGLTVSLVVGVAAAALAAGGRGIAPGLHRTHGGRGASFAAGAHAGDPSADTLSDRTALERRARHEAAHAIAALAQGGAVHSVDIRIQTFSGVGGTCLSEPARHLSAQDKVWAQLVVSVAANVADHEAGEHTIGSSQDLDLALRQMAGLISIGIHPRGYDGELRFDDLLAAARDRASEILTRNKLALEALAERLVATSGTTELTPADLAAVQALIHLEDAAA